MDSVCRAFLVGLSTLSVLLLLPGQLSAQDSATGVVESFISAFNAHDVDAMLDLVHKDVEWLFVDGDTVLVETDNASELAASMNEYFDSIPSSRSTIESIMRAGRFVAVWERAHWDREGEAMSQSSLAVYEVVDARIRRVWYYPSIE